VVFGKYREIKDFQGNRITSEKLLDYVREVVTDYAVHQILHNGIAEELSPLTRFYILWRWSYGEARVHFDDARKLAQSTGVDIERELGKGFIKKEQEYVRVLGPQDRRLEDLKDSRELIDILHKALLLWKMGMKEEMKKLLAGSGWGTKESFYRTAQAISETLPQESQEKKLLDGFLGGKDRIISEVRESGQRGLF